MKLRTNQLVSTKSTGACMNGRDAVARSSALHACPRWMMGVECIASRRIPSIGSDSGRATARAVTAEDPDPAERRAHLYEKTTAASRVVSQRTRVCFSGISTSSARTHAQVATLLTMAAAAAQRLLAASTKIIGVGRNYIAHAKELGNPVPKEPVLFLKPTSSFLHAGVAPALAAIEVPESLESLHHEVELAVVISKRGRDVPEESAMDFVGGYALALDMTARDLQSVAKSAGLPWTLAKGQDTFTPISAVVPKSAVTNPDDLELWLKVDDEIKQKGSTSDMMFKIPFLISYISSIMTLMEGDVILTGTPEGVGPVRVGQKIKAGITDLIDVEFDVQRRKRAFST